MVPFGEDTPQGLWERLAKAFSRNWPDSAVVFALFGMAEDDTGHTDGAVDYFVQALHKDPAYWLAAWCCAGCYAAQKNWRAARGYYLRALKSETASLFPALHFDLAWCCGKIKEYDAEKQAYKECLKLDPDYPYARNNLGWSLMKARKYEDAVLVFREAIKRGKDGNYPLRNLARALRRLGRYSEAIEALRQNVHRGAVTPRAQREIAELEALLRKQAAGGKLDDDVPTEEPGEGGEAGTARWPGKLGAISTRAQKRTAPGTGSKPISGREGPPSETPHHQKSNCIPTEETLEGLLEEMIRRDGQAFGRKLRMFESAEGLYGRQLPIPGIGRIDLLVEDIETRELIVVELKRERDTDAVVGQLLRYIGWVQKNLAQGNQKVRGIICLHGSSEKLRLAVSPLPDVEVYEYNLSLKKLYPSRVGESHPA
jgi:Flp pilus assembly protein TadD